MFEMFWILKATNLFEYNLDALAPWDFWQWKIFNDKNFISL